jgi:cytochrome c oxidase subunit 4
MSHVVGTRTYVGVFALLLSLTAVTVFAARIDFGAQNTPIALGIALVKAVLVVLYFMHVRYRERLVALFVCAGVLWLVILFAFTFSDYLTRPWEIVPGW